MIGWVIAFVIIIIVIIVVAFIYNKHKKTKTTNATKRVLIIKLNEIRKVNNVHNLLTQAINFYSNHKVSAREIKRIINDKNKTILILLDTQSSSEYKLNQCKLWLNYENIPSYIYNEKELNQIIKELKNNKSNNYRKKYYLIINKNESANIQNIYDILAAANYKFIGLSIQKDQVKSEYKASHGDYYFFLMGDYNSLYECYKFLTQYGISCQIILESEKNKYWNYNSQKQSYDHTYYEEMEFEEDEIEEDSNSHTKNTSVEKNINYYDILGIDKTATQAEIKKAFYSLAKKYHPDVNKEANAEEKFKKINEAYQTLSDNDKRTIYDYDNNI